MEKSFEVFFEEDELIGLRTFGGLIDKTSAKLHQIHNSTCTSQQLFYRVRRIIDREFGIRQVSLDNKIEQIFPKEHRLSEIEEFEKGLGFKIGITKASKFYETTNIIFLLVSFGLLFSAPIYGIVGIIIGIQAVKFGRRNGASLKVRTVRDLVKKIVRENYLKSRKKHIWIW